MALFGAPLAHEDHSVRVCYAALRMQDRISRYGENVLRSQAVPINIRVGLNSDEVVVRSIGNDLNMDYTAVWQITGFVLPINCPSCSRKLPYSLCSRAELDGLRHLNHYLNRFGSIKRMLALHHFKP